MDKLYIDVRETDEYKNGHIAGAVNLPLSNIENWKDSVKTLADKFSVVLVCKSGMRAQNAYNQLAVKDNVSIYEGGMNKWPQDQIVTTAEKKRKPIMQQVMIAAGLLVLAGSLGAIFIEPKIIWLTVFVGAGLLFAGVTGICLMAKMLGAMPWNK